jgi:hypothetical protein
MTRATEIDPKSDENLSARPEWGYIAPRLGRTKNAASSLRPRHFVSSLVLAPFESGDIRDH